MRSRRVRVHGTGPLMRMFPLFRLELRVRRSAVVEKWVSTDLHTVVVYNETTRSEHRLRHLRSGLQPALNAARVQQAFSELELAHSQDGLQRAFTDCSAC